MEADILAFVGVYGGIAFIVGISWRLYGMIIHGKSFLPHPSFQRTQTIPETPSRVLEHDAEEVQIGKGYNLKEMEGEEYQHVWDIAVIGMVHHLYTVYATHENNSIARDRYIEHGWFTSTEYEYLIGPEKPGKQSSPGLLRRAGIVKTVRENGQPASNILPIADPIEAIASLFSYMDTVKQNSEVAGTIADIQGTSYLLPNVEEGFGFEEEEVPYS